MRQISKQSMSLQINISYKSCQDFSKYYNSQSDQTMDSQQQINQNQLQRTSQPMKDQTVPNHCECQEKIYQIRSTCKKLNAYINNQMKQMNWIEYKVFKEIERIHQKSNLDKCYYQYQCLLKSYKNLKQAIKLCKREQAHNQDLKKLQSDLEQIRKLYVNNNHQYNKVFIPLPEQQEQFSLKQVLEVKNLTLAKMANSKTRLIISDRNLKTKTTSELEDMLSEVKEEEQDYRIKCDLIKEKLEPFQEKKEIKDVQISLESYQVACQKAKSIIENLKASGSRFTFGQSQ